MNIGKMLAIRTVMMPKDTNYMGHIFGGRILSLIDLAAAQHSMKITPKKFVTKVMKEVNFIAPVYVGDAVNFFTETIKTGHTSVTVKVVVEAESIKDPGKMREVTTAEVIMVAVDDNNRPVKLSD